MKHNQRALAAYYAAVEAVEAGASRHCVVAVLNEEGTAIVGYHHCRLGIRVFVEDDLLTYDFAA